MVRPFSRNLRTEISKMPKIFLCDTGLMQMLWLKRLQREVLGPVFETSIYAELLKRYAADQIGYWRTTDKKEIDFILSLPAGPLPVEAKLGFPHATPAAIRSFLESGGAKMGNATDYRVVALYGKPAGECMIYPWQLT